MEAQILTLKTSIVVSALSKGWCAETIRIARLAKGLTQAELAAELGCRQQTISEWELNAYAPKNAYQKLLNQFFAMEGGAAQDVPAAAPSGNPSTPAAADSFTVSADQLRGTLKYMEMNSLEELQIAFRDVKQTFENFDSNYRPATSGQGRMDS